MTNAAETAQEPDLNTDINALTHALVEAIACYVTFLALGFTASEMVTLISRSKIAFLFTFGSERFIFTAVELPSETVARQAVREWRKSLADWRTLPVDITRLMIAKSNALVSVPAFLELLSHSGHLPPLGLDGTKNNTFEAPCPFCKLTLLCKYDPNSPTVEHPSPICSDFMLLGGSGALTELNRRSIRQMVSMNLGMEVPRQEQVPS